jgi:hypothetical protein
MAALAMETEPNNVAASSGNVRVRVLFAFENETFDDLA